VNQSLTNYHAGLCAEDTVLRHYQRLGFRQLAQRWRGQAGEIDLIVQNDSITVFVEVKKSQSFEQAAASLGARQQARIYGTASEYLAQEVGALDVEARFDVAVVDAIGAVHVIENAFGMM